MIYIFDLDGTIADITHRLHFIGATSTTFVPYQDVKDWEAFYAAAVDDEPIWEVITVARALGKAGHTIVYSTGRSENTRKITDAWMDKYRLPVGEMFMRADKDHREDCIVKAEFLDRIKGILGTNIGGAFEDRQQVVDMYREKGVRVFQVAKGDF
jgi:hypothetical protein